MIKSQKGYVHHASPPCNKSLIRAERMFTSAANSCLDLLVSFDTNCPFQSVKDEEEQTVHCTIG